MPQIQERGSTHVYKVNKISREEIEGMVSLCVHEQPPFCNAACPLKLDTRAFLKAAAAGDFKKALQLYEKIAPFPLILSQGCEAPCEAKCRLCEIGDGVAVRAVEAAVARYGEASRGGSVFRSSKRKTVAIFGSGLFVLFLAGELEKKAYPLRVFCEQESLEAFLRAAAPFLDEEAFSLELKRLRRKEIQFEFESRIDRAFLEEKRRQEEEGTKCLVRVDGYTDFIFINRFGMLQHQSTLNKAIRRITRDSNDAVLRKNPNAKVLLPHFSCHSLRHTFTTRMCEADVNVKVIQDTLGHADISTTLNIYADVTKDLKKAEFEGLDKWFAKSMGQKNGDKNTGPETGDREEGDS